MKTWKKPEAVGQEFAANEYVSACTVTVRCDYWPTGISGRYKQLIVPEDIRNSAGMSVDKYYEPCRTEYTYDVNVTALQKIVFTQTAEGDNIGKHLAYYWIETEADGSKDFHVTSITTEEIEASKS